MNQKNIKISSTKTFEQTADDLITYLTQWSDEQIVIERVEKLVVHFEEKVSDNPFIYSRCAALTEYGIVNIREFKRDGFRLLYEVEQDNETTFISVLLLLRQNQSIQEQLIEHCLLNK